MRVLVESVRMAMRDGTGLAADLYREDVDRRRPVLLVRTPYPRRAAASQIDALGLARDGWLVCVQSVRGRDGSDGEFQPFVQERDDGRDSVAWCRAHPQSDGDVAMSGASYEGWTQWAAAAGEADRPRAICPQITARDVKDVWFRSGGTIRQSFLQSWGMSLAYTSGRLAPAEFERATAVVDDLRTLYRTHPADSPLAGLLAPYRSWTDPHDAAYWSRLPPVAAADLDDVAVIQVTGWYDIFCAGALRDHAELAGRRPAAPRRLVVGPWAHDMALPQVTGSVDHSLRGHGGYHGVVAAAHGWLRRRLAGEPVETGARLFLLGTNRWQEYPAWPVPAEEHSLPLDPHRGRIGVPAGDGPAASGPVSLTGEPEPLELPGGRSLDPCRPTPGPFRIGADVTDRSDVLALRSDPLTDPLVVAGASEVRLPACTTSGGPVFGILCRIDADGTWTTLVEGCVEVGPAADPTEIVIPVGPIAFELLPGTSLGLIVSLSFSSAYWPGDRYPGRHLHIGRPADGGPMLHLRQPSGGRHLES